MLGDGFDGLQEIRRFALAPGGESAIRDLESRVRDDKALIEEQFNAQAVAIRAGSMRGVERKCARLNLRDADAVVRADKRRIDALQVQRVET